MRRAALVACLGLVMALAVGPRVTAQSATFEVASVKPSNPNPPDLISSIPRIMPVGNRFTAANVQLRLLIRIAYGVQDFQISGGPSDLMSAKFDITAKAEDGTGTTSAGVLVMLKSLLAERFRLKTHTETKEMPIYALVMARSDGKLGADIKPSTSECGNQAETQKRMEALAKEGPGAMAKALTGPPIPCTVMPVMGATPGNFGMRGNGQSMATLMQLLTQATGKTVVDKTGLKGLYDWELHFDPEIMLRMAVQAGVNLPPGAAASLPPSDNPALLTALQEQLGLKLDSQRGPVDILVIDGAQAPAPD